MAQRPTAEIKVPSDDPNKKKKEEEEKKATEKKASAPKANGDKKEEEEELVRRTSVTSVPITDGVHSSRKRMLSSNLNSRCWSRD